MTTKRTFECNLCHSAVRDGNGRGFHFGNGRVDWATLQQAENRPSGAIAPAEKPDRNGLV